MPRAFEKTGPTPFAGGLTESLYAWRKHTIPPRVTTWVPAASDRGLKTAPFWNGIKADRRNSKKQPLTA